jgi:hypothetical protein
MSRSTFKTAAKAFKVHITDDAGNTVFVGYAQPKEFSTDSLGWNVSDKARGYEGVSPASPIDIQIGLNMTVIGSKELPKETAKPAGSIAGIVAAKAS